MSVQPSRERAQSPYPGLFGIALIAGALTQLILSAGGAASAEGAKLMQGKPVERQIAKGEKHVYEIDVPAGRVVNGVVDQRGVDVELHIVDPTGARVATLDRPNGTMGPEPWSIDGKTAGTWRIEVVPLSTTVKPGLYEARVDEVITPDERDERRAKVRYQSPRMLALWKQRRADGAAALERFAKEMAGHAPLVEPLADDPGGDVLMTFVRQAGSEVHNVALFTGPATTLDTPLLRFEGTDLWYRTLRVPKDARFTYAFHIGDPLQEGLPLEEQQLQIGPDPWNPHRFPPDSQSSFVELPAAPPQTYAQRVEGVPEGRVVAEKVRSEILHEDRGVSVYLPAAFDAAGGPYPYVVVFDAEVYGAGRDALVPTPTILDNLIAQGKVPPMLAVLVDSQATRDRDLVMSAPFGDFLAQELAPWMRREYRAAEDPARVTIAGSSFGGLCAAYVAFHHPDVFGNVLSQSGSFWISPGAPEHKGSPFSLETGGMMGEIVASPQQPVRFWMEVGLFEGGGGLAGSNMLAQNRHLRDVLLAKGYKVSYHEFSGGHDYACWRGSLADGLMALAGGEAQAVHP